MSTLPPQSETEYRVGPDAEPDRYRLGPVVGAGSEGVLYRGSITTPSGATLHVAVKMLHPRYQARIEHWRRRWAEQVELLRSLQAPGVVAVRDGFVGPRLHKPTQEGERIIAHRIGHEGMLREGLHIVS